MPRENSSYHTGRLDNRTRQKISPKLFINILPTVTRTSTRKVLKTWIPGPFTNLISGKSILMELKNLLDR